MSPDDELLMRLDRDCARRTEAVRAMLLRAGRADLVTELDARLRDVRLGISSAQGTWHALSKAQRRILTMLAEGRYLIRPKHSRTRYNAHGMAGALAESNVCGLATVRNLCARELCHPDGDAFDPERKIIITERGQFVLLHGTP